MTHRTRWLVPYITVVVAWIIRRRVRRSAEQAPDQSLAPVPSVATGTDAELERLNRELAEMEK